MKFRGAILPWGEFFIFTIIAISESEFTYSAILACLIHEFSHLAVCRIVGGKFRGIRPESAGLVISYYPANISYVKEIAVIFSGAFANLILGLLLILLDFPEEAAVNIAVGVINLFPMKGLDGGEMLFAVVSYFKGENIAFKAVKTVSVICSVLLWILTIYYQLRLGINLTLLIMAVYILLIGLR